MRPFKKVIDIEYVAKLARLTLTESERERFTKDLSDILAYVEKLNQIDTELTPPTSHVLSVQNVFRDDEVLPSLPKDVVLANAPQKKGGLFKVPKII